MSGQGLWLRRGNGEASLDVVIGVMVGELWEVAAGILKRELSELGASVLVRGGSKEAVDEQN